MATIDADAPFDSRDHLPPAGVRIAVSESELAELPFDKGLLYDIGVQAVNRGRNAHRAGNTIPLREIVRARRRGQHEVAATATRQEVQSGRGSLAA